MTHPFSFLPGFKARWAKGLFAATLLAWSLASHGQGAVLQDIDRAEQAGWSDPENALQMLRRLESRTMKVQALEELLTVRGLLLVDTRQDAQTQQIVQRLDDMGRQSPMATMDAHIVRAYSFCQQDHLAQAVAELRQINPDSATPILTRYRVQTLRGSVYRFTGQHEDAIVAYERAIDIADAMHSRPRKVAALVRLAWVLEQTGNLDGAVTQLQAARKLATEDEDDAALANIARSDADVAGRRGDRAAERRASFEELQYAQKAQSKQLMALAFGDLGDSYMKTGEFARSLEYSRQAAALVPYIERNSFESTVQFNTAMAQIGLGSVRDGKAAANAAIQHTLDSGNLVDADGLLREYGPALERAGDLRGALDIYHRDDALRDRLMSAAREHALLEVSGKFDAERRTREIEVLKRDNAIKAHDLRAQRLQQRTVLIAATLIALACAALGWAFRRIRKANARLLFESQHDALTTLYNRRYFNEQILAAAGDEPFQGCVLLIDLDHFKRINDTHGHPAGDAILAAAGKRMANVLRNGGRIVRWGGEEFLALLDPMSDAELSAMTHRLLSAIREDPVAWYGKKIQCTVSIGCGRFPVRGARVAVSLERAIGLVDKALYEAKRRGRNRACLLTFVNAATEQDLAAINEDFTAATDDRRVMLVETISPEVFRRPDDTIRIRAV